MTFKIQPFEVRNFEVGLVEDFQNFDRRANTILENLLITDDDKLESRHGSELLAAPNDRVPSETRITALAPELNGTNNFFSLTDRRLYHLNPDWTELQGPTSNKALSKMESDGQVSTPEWRGHLLLVDDSLSNPAKVYRTSANVLTLVQAGLPALDNTIDDFDTAAQTVLIVARVNSLKAALNTHYTNTPGTSHKIADPTSITTADSTDLTTAQALLAEIRTNYIVHRKDIDDGAFTFHTQNSIPWTDLLTGPAGIPDEDAPVKVPETVDQINELTLSLDAHFINQHAHNALNAGGDDPSAMPVAGGASDIAAFGDPLTQIKTGVHAVQDRSAIHNYLLSAQNSYLDHIQDGSGGTFAHDNADNDNDLGPSGAAFDPGTFVADFNGRRLRIRDIHGVFQDGGISSQAASVGIGHLHPNPLALYHTTDILVPAGDLTPEVPAETFFYSVPFGDYSALNFQLNDFATKFNLHDDDLGSHYSGAGAPQGGVHNISTPAPTISNYIYSLHYFFEYTVGAVEFEDNGPVLTIPLLNTSPVELIPNTLQNIPVLTNTADQNFDTVTIKIKIHRTANNGTDSRLVGTITNGTTTFVDDIPDSQLSGFAQLYTAGGVIQNDPVPKAKYSTIFNNIAYYASLDIDGELFPRRIRHSISNDIDGTPATFFLDMPFDITGISSASANVLAFGATTMSRLTGNFTETGGGSFTAETIANTVGAVNHRGIVQVEGGLYFAGNDGIYFTDGFQVRKLTEQLEDFYAAFVKTDAQRRRVYGTYDPINRRVWWSMTSNEDIGENDICLVLDTTKGLRATSSFTVIKGNNQEFQPAALLFRNEDLLRGDRNGYIFQHEPRLRSDPKKDLALTDPTDWTTAAIKWDIKSLNIPFGSTVVKKWVPRMNFTARDAGDLSIGITSINDNTKQSNPRDILHRLTRWGDPTGLLTGPGWVQTWRDSIEGIVDQWRHFPAKNLRCEYKQMEFKNADAAIVNSDTYGLATIDSTSKIIELDNNLSSWPKNPEDYRIAFEGDSFVQEFLVTDSLNNRPADLLFYTSCTKLTTGTTLVPVIDYTVDNIVPVYTGDAKVGVTAGELDLSLMTLAAEFVRWEVTSQFSAPAKYTVRFVINPNFTGTPADTQSVFVVQEGGVTKLALDIDAAGDMGFDITDGTGSLVSGTRGTLAFTSGTPVLVELDVDFTLGDARIFIDGTQLGADIALTAARPGHGWDTIGIGQLANATKRFTYDNITVYNTVKNTASHTALASEIPPDITVSDADNDLTNLSGQKWVLRGVQKEEKLSLLSYILQWAPFGRSQRDFEAADDGEND